MFWVLTVSAIILSFVFLVLKTAGRLTWPWIWVWCPVWSFALVICMDYAPEILVAALLIQIRVEYIEKSEKNM